MIRTNSGGKETLKQMRKREADQKEIETRKLCAELADSKIGVEEMKRLSNSNKGVWFMPAVAEDGSIEALAILKPIDRHILSYASTKLDDDGLYSFLEQCIIECFLSSVEPDGTVKTVASESVFIDDDEYFIPAAQKFNKIMESKKIAFLKR